METIEKSIHLVLNAAKLQRNALDNRFTYEKAEKLHNAIETVEEAFSKLSSQIILIDPKFEKKYNNLESEESLVVDNLLNGRYGEVCHSDYWNIRHTMYGIHSKFDIILDDYENCYFT